MKHPLCTSRAAFTLIELLTVLAIVGLLAGVSAAVFGGMRSTGLQTATATVSSTASMARDLAVTANRHVRFAVIDDSGQNPEGWRLQRYGILRQKGIDPASSEWEVAAPFSQLPTGVYFGRNEKSVGQVEGQMIERTATGTIQGKTVSYFYVEFLPTGAAGTVSGANIFSLVGKTQANGTVVNAANISHVGVSQHTGRVRVERPE